MGDKVNAYLYKPSSVTINGTKYERQRMGIDLEVRLADLLFDAFTGLDVDIESVDSLSVGDMAGLLILLLRKKQFVDRVLGFLRDLLVGFPLSVQEMHDANKFPMGSEVRIIESVVTDEDAKDFFVTMRRLLKLKSRLKGTRKRSQKKSTSSKKGTAGRTKK